MQKLDDGCEIFNMFIDVLFRLGIAGHAHAYMANGLFCVTMNISRDDWFTTVLDYAHPI